MSRNNEQKLFTNHKNVNSPDNLPIPLQRSDGSPIHPYRCLLDNLQYQNEPQPLYSTPNSKSTNNLTFNPRNSQNLNNLENIVYLPVVTYQPFVIPPELTYPRAEQQGLSFGSSAVPATNANDLLGSTSFRDLQFAAPVCSTPKGHTDSPLLNLNISGGNRTLSQDSCYFSANLSNDSSAGFGTFSDTTTHDTLSSHITSSEDTSSFEREKTLTKISDMYDQFRPFTNQVALSVLYENSIKLLQVQPAENVEVRTESEYWEPGSSTSGAISDVANYSNTTDFDKENDCKFCYKNKEPSFIYKNHRFKDNDITICPVLRNYPCPYCNVTGERAHTAKYCTTYNKSTLDFTNIMENSSTVGPDVSLNYFKKRTTLESTSNDISNLMQFERPQSLTITTNTIKHSKNSVFTKAKINKQDLCKFCRKNYNFEEIYVNHRLRAENGNVECPFLRVHVCEICGATGDNAHTRKHCPHNTYQDFIDTVL